MCLQLAETFAATLLCRLTEGKTNMQINVPLARLPHSLQNMIMLHSYWSCLSENMLLLCCMMYKSTRQRWSSLQGYLKASESDNIFSFLQQQCWGSAQALCIWSATENHMKESFIKCSFFYKALHSISLSVSCFLVRLVSNIQYCRNSGSYRILDSGFHVKMEIKCKCLSCCCIKPQWEHSWAE